MKKLVITGPECSGKSTLAAALSVTLKGTLIPEIARPMLHLTLNQYQKEDLTTMARYQMSLELAAEGCDQDWMICDTSILVFKIWSAYRFGSVDPLIEHYYQQSSTWLWLLCQPLSQWYPDPLRVNEANRDELFNMYLHELSEAGKDFLIVPDLSREERISWVIKNLPQY